MTTAEKLLALLREGAGSPRSGQELAEILGVSRAAVWKAVSALRAQGISIDAATNRGYCLAGDVLDPREVEALAPGTAVELLSSVDSTNRYLRERAAAGAPAGTAFIARQQTAGRGRLGRTFYSPQSTGLYLSVLLRPETYDATLTAAAAVAMARAVEESVGISLSITWVNDLYLGEKKVCGILTEGSFSLENGAMEYAVVGAGLNLTEPPEGFPEPLAGIAGAVLPAPRPGAKTAIAGRFLRYLLDCTRQGPAAFLPEYRTRNLVPGRTVTVHSGDTPRTAQAIAIDDQCRLIVRYPNGQTQPLTTGEVTL